jgi:hypothetical protein
MELIGYFAILVVLARALGVLGRVYARASPSGLLDGMFSAPTLGWPVGVQEEDREQIWNWTAPAPDPAGSDAQVVADADRATACAELQAGFTEDFALAGAIEDIAVAPIPVQRVR